MLPIKKGKCPTISVLAKSEKRTSLKVELRISSKYFNHTPDNTIESLDIKINEGEHIIDFNFTKNIPCNCYAFICFMSNEDIDIKTSEYRISGLLTVFNKVMPDVSNLGKQTPPNDIGVEEFEFWCPERRPEGHNIAMTINPSITEFALDNLHKIHYRPINRPNAWVADLTDNNAHIKLEWKQKEHISTIVLFTDTDFDHPMETVQWGHSDSKMPFCVDNIEIYDENNNLIANTKNNYKTIVKFKLNKSVETKNILIKLGNSTPKAPVSLFYIHVE
jgi:hypothetical protein